MNYTLLKTKAIDLRKQGFTYSEILKQIPVAKSTLSLWLRDIGLSKQQVQKISDKRIAASLKGGAIRKQQRIIKTQLIHKKALKDIGKITKRELWLIGTMLYWAEGSKEKDYFISMVEFTNSDPLMIKVFIKWLFEIIKVKKEDLILDIFLHDNNKHRINDVINHWSVVTGYDKTNFQHIYFKKHKPKTNRRNIGDNYFGTLKIKVRKSADLNRKIAGWIKGVVEYLD